MNNLNSSTQNEKIEIKVLFDRLLVFWKQTALSILIFLTIGFLYNWYSTKIYKSSTTILIKEDSNSGLGSEDLFGGLDLFGGQKNIKNEIGILRSFSLTRKTLEDLNLRISYFHSGSLVSKDIYDKTPFTVNLINSTPLLIDQKYYVKIISENEYQLEVDFKDAKLFDLKEENYVSNDEYDFEYENTHKFGELVSTDFFEFKLEKNDLSLFVENEWDTYYFIVNNYNDLTQAYMKKINIIETDKESSILKITHEGSNPKKINDFLEKFNFHYLQIGLNEKNQIASNTIFFINDQLTSISDSLNKVENDLENFKQSNPKIQLSKDEYSTYFQIEKLEEEKAILELNNKYYLSVQKYLSENNDIDNIVAPSAMGINDPLLNELISELTRLYSQLEVASINSRSEHPIVQSLQNQIQNTKNILNENIENIISNSELSLVDINTRIKQIETEINKLPRKERVLLNIQRKFNLNEIIYNYLLEKRAEASITKASNVSDHKIIDSPRLISNEPVEPNTMIVYAFSLLLGLFVPIISITLYFVLNDKIIDKKDIDQITDVPVIGKIMTNESENNIVTVNSPKSAITESFRAIRTNIQYLAAEKAEKVICITSSISREGKTFIAINLSSIISLTGEKTILIGADLRKPKIFDDFNLKNTVGLSSYLSNQKTKEEIINKTQFENLDIILSGPIPPNPSELLNNEKMSNFIKELKKEYKYIVIDTPPIGLVTDGLILMKHSDINIYVVRQNYTTKEMLKGFNDLVTNNNLQKINLIINDISTDKSSHGYGYGYGDTYGYGYYNESESNLSSKKWWKKS
ncbi:MAG: polysaccharide biosynthesis tyrosine autokinase [Flavobacteriales bacterium]|nr:polysaccharide biosynthesis tyrosine autokinase [Flavobacteriales bacterium]